ncbi:divalent-cation tolerance protein CutA [Thermodesulfovibrionales bacterium]|nr:divalent-cation tolerance protein CutA [Thermodesulfovibrionales bacterium]
MLEVSMEAIVVYITVSNEEEAAKIARTIVEERLAGCVNIVKGIRSIYSWEGRIEDDAEVLIIAKTQRHLFELLKERINDLHSYDVPEIIAMAIAEGSENYLNWLKGVTR